MWCGHMLKRRGLQLTPGNGCLLKGEMNPVVKAGGLRGFWFWVCVCACVKKLYMYVIWA